MKTKKFIPKENQNYWRIIVDSFGVRVDKRKRDYFDVDRAFESNCFKTEKEASAIAEEFKKLLKNETV